jgi:hypothetical protein
METNIPASSITLNYTCADDNQTATQPLADITFVGTLICPDCGEDMALDPTVTVDTTNRGV